MTPNQFSINLGKVLVNNGLKFIQQGFHINPKECGWQEMIDFISAKLNIQLSLKDRKFYLIDWETWKQFIKIDWIEEKKYIEDRFDCDNFAQTFSAHASELFDISVATCYGKVYHKNNNQFIDYHEWSVIITKEIDGAKHLYFYEPMNDQSVEVLDKNNITIANWRYEPIKIYVW